MTKKPGLRVTGGTVRGRVLALVPGPGTRPTSSILREAIFASLAGVDGLTVLDLCSGSGLLAIEALSRGAAAATCVDSAGPAIRTIHANLSDAGFADLAEVLRRRADLFLKKTDTRYDLLLADPPYADAALAAAIGYDGLTAAFARKIGAGVLVRGLRALSDFEYEFALAAMNRDIDPRLETVCLVTSSDHTFISSSIIREIAAHGQPVDKWVPPNVARELHAKLYGVQQGSSQRE